MKRFLRLTALGGVVVAVLITMILRTGLASATSKSSCGGWNVVSSPSPDSSFNSLNGIAAVSANDIWAVGFSDSIGLIEHWDGTQWTVLPSSTPGTVSP